MFSPSFTALESPAFRSYLSGQCISACGTGLQQVALSWLVYNLTNSACALGILAVSMLSGQVLFSFMGGYLADRCNRLALLIKLQWLGIFLALILTTLVALKLKCLFLILGFAFLFGAFSALEYPCRQSLYTEFVKPNQFASARGLYSGICASTLAFGQALSGILIEIAPNMGEALCAGLNALSFTLSLLFLKSLSRNTVKDLESNNSTNKTTSQDNKANLKLALSSDIILITLIQTSVLVLFGLRYVSLLPAFAVEIFNAGSKTTGILTAALALGFATGSLICASFRDKTKLELWSYLSLLFLPFGLFLFCHAANITLALLCIFVLAIFQSININACICLLQIQTHASLIGRLMGLRVTLVAICDLIGALVVSLLIQKIGLQSTIMLTASICLFFAICIYARHLTHRASLANLIPAVSENLNLNKKKSQNKLK